MPGQTPLLGALANVRHKMNRQTMRFLGDADARPPAASPRGPDDLTTPPPADQSAPLSEPRQDRGDRAASGRASGRGVG